jgi:predicted dehydrogenase
MTLGAGLVVSPLLAEDAAALPDAAVAPNVLPEQQPNKQLRTAIVGCGRHGRALINACMKIADMRLVAVCDILPSALNSAKLYLEWEDIAVSAYADFAEMLAACCAGGTQEQANLDAVIIATPDFVHAEQAVAAMNAGLHVYCESPMATNAADARRMIRTSKSTGRLLQIGFERRSEPRYRHAATKLVAPESLELLLGTITHFETQANRRVHSELIWAERDTLAPEYLARYGYRSMNEYRNWRQYREYACGPCATYFAQQFDVFEWFFGVRPEKLIASGGPDYYAVGDCPDNASAILTYPFPHGVVRSVGRVWSTTSGGGRLPFEHVFGTSGSLQTSVSAEEFRVFAEPGFAKWNEFLRRGDLKKMNVAPEGEDPNQIRVRETGNVVPYLLPMEREESVFRLHVENFINAVFGKEPLNCPGEQAFTSHIIAWCIDEAVAKGVTIDLPDELFVVE